MRRGRLRTAVVALVGVLAAGCTSSADRSTAEAGGPPSERAYWPTDGWRTAPAEDHGFDSDEIAEIERLVADSFTNVRSILIVRDGYLVYERYWQGLDETAGHDVRSVTKSVVSALVGIALAGGWIESLDATMGDLFADKLPAGADPRMADVTVRQLLSMTSGLPGDDPGLGGTEEVFARIEREDDWAQAILGLPLTGDPGSKWAYSSASSHLLSVLVADATGRSPLDFARDELFGPLGIDTSGAYVSVGPPTPESLERYSRAPVAWPADPQGYNFGGAYLKLPTRDLARFGFLYLNEGRWEDEQLIPADYVRESVTDVGLPTGSGDGYGWQWWVPDNDDGSFFARGAGGQTIYVHQDLDLVAVVTSDPETPRGAAYDLVEFAVLPAAEE